MSDASVTTVVIVEPVEVVCFACSTGRRLCDEHICPVHKSKNLPRDGCRKCCKTLECQDTTKGQQKTERFYEILDPILREFEPCETCLDLEHCPDIRSSANKQATVTLLTRGIEFYERVLLQEHPETKRTILTKRLEGLQCSLRRCKDRPDMDFL